MPRKSRDFEKDPIRSVDLHGLAPFQALRRLELELHAARVRGEERLLVITGRGWGNQKQRPILRGKVETWLRGADGARYRVAEIRVVSKGGALELRLEHPQDSARRARARDQEDAEEDERASE